MASLLLTVIFVVTFYFAFKTIWKNVTTVSYDGLRGFIHSWWSQILWALVIAGVVTGIAATILDKVIGSLSGFDFSDITTLMATPLI